MTVLDLVEGLRNRGAVVELAGERLRIDAPPGVLTGPVKETLRQAKPAIVKLLSASRPAPSVDVDEWEELCSYYLGRCHKCRRILHGDHLNLVEVRTWECIATSDCRESRRRAE